MTDRMEDDFHPRILFLISAAGAVLLGLVNLWATDAPSHYLAINAVALLVGYVLLAIVDRIHPSATRANAVIWCAAAVLLATAVFGEPADGASRWLRLAGLSVQPSFILLPLLVLSFARTGSWFASLGVALAAFSLALQPDRGMAGVLAAGLAAIALMRSDRPSWAAALASVISFVITLFQSDRLPAVPHVDQVLTTAFGVDPVAGVAVIIGTVLLVMPAGIAWARDPRERIYYVALGAVWVAAITAAVLGNYPTPVVGYGGSAIIGYVLALGALRKASGPVSADTAIAHDEAIHENGKGMLRASISA